MFLATGGLVVLVGYLAESCAIVRMPDYPGTVRKCKHLLIAVCVYVCVCVCVAVVLCHAVQY